MLERVYIYMSVCGFVCLCMSVCVSYLCAYVFKYVYACDVCMYAWEDIVQR